MHSSGWPNPADARKRPIAVNECPQFAFRMRKSFSRNFEKRFALTRVDAGQRHVYTCADAVT